MTTISTAFSKKNRALLYELVKTDFKLRYQGSAIGYAWSLLKPLFMFAILYVVFTMIFPLGKDIPHYPVYLFTGIILWSFFTEITQQSLGCIVGRGDLIRKIKIPRWMIVFSTSLNALINLCLNLIVLAVFMVFNQVSLTTLIFFLPILIIEVYVLGVGVACFLSAAYVRYRDVQYIWDVLLQAGLYLTPILYPMTLITNHLYQKIMLLNPMAQAIQDARYVIVSQDPVVITSWRAYENGWCALIPIAIVLLVFVFGVRYFNRQSKDFAENL